MLATRIRQSPSGQTVAEKVVDLLGAPVALTTGDWETVMTVEVLLFTDMASEQLSIETFTVNASGTFVVPAVGNARLKFSLKSNPSTNFALGLTASADGSFFGVSSFAGSLQGTGRLFFSVNELVVVEFQMRGTAPEQVSAGSMVALVQ